MDQPSSSLDQNVDLSKLSQKDKQELQQFIVNESQKARIQQCRTYSFLLPVPPYTSFSSYSNSFSIHNLAPFVTPYLDSEKKWYCKSFANDILYSGTQPHRYLLEEMHNVLDSKREAGEGRGELYAELRGSVFGCEFYGY
jgi:hypothetical protein